MNAPKLWFTALRDALKRQPSLKGVEVTIGARTNPRNSGPWLIRLVPTDGKYAPSSSKPENIYDVKQQFRAECWAKGQTNDPDSDFDACWYLHTLFVQALEGQARDFDGSGAAGFYYDGLTAGWNTDVDTNAQGVAFAVLFFIQLPIPAAAFDEGHVGSAWPTGPVDATQIEVTYP